MGRKNPSVRDEESGRAGVVAKRKSKKVGEEALVPKGASNKRWLSEEDVRDDGKKKGKGKNSGTSGLFGASAFAILGEEDDSETKGNDEGLEEPVIELKEEVSVLKIGEDTAKGDQEGAVESEYSDFIEPNQHIDETTTKKQTDEDVPSTSKNKKKKRKGGKKTLQEEDDFDKILAEFGAVHVLNSAETPDVPPPNLVAEENEDEGPVVSAASRKNKKKKEKERERKAAAAEDKQNGANNAAQSNKLAEEKTSKPPRKFLEKLEKIKEAEEKKQREEEERLRKEEEERLRIEDEERIAEEKKPPKSEKDKPKGKTKKRQLLGNASVQRNTAETSGAATKRPVYQKKKPNPQAHSNRGATLDSVEGTVPKDTQQEQAENIEDVASSSAEDKADSRVVQENAIDDEDEEEWDAKIWDDADLKLPGKSAFDDEEFDSGPEHYLLKKEIKSAHTATQDVEAPSLATKAVGSTEKVARCENADLKKKKSEDKINSKNHINREQKNKKAQKSDDHPIQNGQNLRSPICCIMGHVDSGKTKLLDCIRGTNVQDVEAGGITQQIGATYFPAENILEKTRELKADARLNVPGLLVIDTPGHESFNNLRSRGSGLCDIAILVVDIMHGLKPQTIESLNLLKMRNTYFIVALNKVDKLNGWKTCPNAPIRKALEQQTRDVEILFHDGLKKVKYQLQGQGLNTELYYKNKESWDTFNIVPTSAISGEGIPDLLLLLVYWAQKKMIERLTYNDQVQCTVLEVKVVEGHGATVDVILVNGVLHEGDQIVVCGMQGPIVTTIRSLLTPHPMKELRVKGTYLHHKEIKAAMCIKITGQGLDHTITGSSLYVVGPHDDLEGIKESAMDDMKSVMSRIDISGEGVYVQASTLGSLEALLEFLKNPAVNIPVSGINIGPVHKKDVMKASVMLEKKKEYGTILAFDVKVTQEARDMADGLGVKIFTADIIYHLFDQFNAYIDYLKEEKKKEAAEEAVFPCVLKIVPNCVIRKSDPIILGVDVLEGIVKIIKIGTPICVPQKEFIEIGSIESIEINNKPLDYAKKGQQVSIKLTGKNSDEQQKMFGRHFEIEDELVSKISRVSLDAIKQNFADDVSPELKKLLFKLRSLFKIS